PRLQPGARTGAGGTLGGRGGITCENVKTSSFFLLTHNRHARYVYLHTVPTLHCVTYPRTPSCPRVVRPRRRPAQARQGSGGRSVTTSANSPIRTPIMSRLALSLRLLPVALGLALLAGCGPTGPVRYEITGMVLYDGKPLDDGVIYFEP